MKPGSKDKDIDHDNDICEATQQTCMSVVKEGRPMQDQTCTTASMQHPAMSSGLCVPVHASQSLDHRHGLRALYTWKFAVADSYVVLSLRPPLSYEPCHPWSTLARPVINETPCDTKSPLHKSPRHLTHADAHGTWVCVRVGYVLLRWSFQLPLWPFRTWSHLPLLQCSHRPDTRT